MKNFASSLLAGLCIPAAFAITFHQSSLSPKNIPTTEIGHPYIIDIIDPDGSHETALRGISVSSDPFEIANSLGANPYQEDKFNVFPAINMQMGGKITIYRAPVFTIIDGKKKYVIRSWQKTVGDLLTEQKIPELGKDDKVNFPIDTALENNMEVRINRVAKTTVMETESIDYQIIKKNNPNLEKGTKNILTAGQDGKKNKYYLVTRVDGEEVSRVLQKTEVAVAPVSQVIEIGTKVVVYATGQATWYVKSSDMIAASNTIPRGTRVTIVNVNNGKRVTVTISGGGIQHEGNVVVDLSTGAFQALGASLGTGILGNVRVEKYYPPED